MPDNFIQWLIVFLILLVGGKDLVVMVLRKRGLINGNGDRKVEKKLNEIESNHLEHVQHGINELQRVQDKILFILEDFKENGIKLRD